MVARLQSDLFAPVRFAAVCLMVLLAVDSSAQESKPAENASQPQRRGFGAPPWFQAIRALSRETTDSDVQRILEQDDTNNDGKIGKGDRIRGNLSRNFDQFDTNSDGFLDPAELKKTGLRPFGGKVFLEAFDKDKDGQLTKEEAIHPSLSRGFSRLDKDGNGKLDESEMDSTRGGMLFGGRAQSGRGGPAGGFGFGGNARGGRFDQLIDEALKADADEDGKLSKEEAREPVADLFDAFDTDQDGFVSKTELRAHTRWLSLGRFAEIMLERSDTNNDGKISREEAATSREQSVIRSRFDQLDVDKSGDVTRAEFIKGFPAQGFGGGRGGFAGGGRGRIGDRVVTQLDKDEDDKISRDEASADKLIVGLFEELDANQDDFIDAAEATRRYATIARARQVDRILDENDGNSDGLISKTEASKELSGLFEDSDSNKDGLLDRHELTANYTAINRATGPARFGAMMLQRADGDGDGKLSEDEFTPVLTRLSDFETADSNHDGFVDAEELRKVFQSRRRSTSRNSSTPQVLFRRNDRDGDGKITRNEANSSLKEYFDVYDVNADGQVTQEELNQRFQLGQIRMNERRLGRRLIGVNVRIIDGKPGIAVNQVTSGAPASIAGVQAGDQILSINGVKVENMIAFRDAVNSGELELKTTVLRGADELELKILLDPIEENQGGAIE